VNLECDVIAKHVERLFQSLDLGSESRLNVEKLREEGF
jgi:riboflavin synthase alpha subunit